MNRVFGSPFTLTFHQEVHLLRHKGLPYKTHCKSAFNAGLHRVLKGVPSSFCALVDPSTKKQPAGEGSGGVPGVTPTWNPLFYLSSKNRRNTRIPVPLFHQLLEAFEEGFKPEPPTSTPKTDSIAVSSTAHNPSVLINPFEFPKKNLVAWALTLYAATNLGQVGSMFRWLHGGGSNVVEGHIQFLSKTTAVVPGLLTILRNKVRDLMRQTLREIGLGEELEPYMINHFWRLCNALEAHCLVMEAKRGSERFYLLDTHFPTIADIAVGSVFEAYFLMDDPPAMEVMEGYPALYRYLQRMMHVRPDEVATTSATNGADETVDWIEQDTIPPSLLPLLTLALEVLPVHVSQCDSMRLFAHSLLTKASTGGGEVQEVGPISLEHVRRTVMGYGMQEELTAAASDPTTTAISGFIVKPKLAEASWTLMADNSIITSCAKVQEVELAQLAAQGAMGLYPRSNNINRISTAIPYIDTLALCGEHIFKKRGLEAPLSVCVAKNYEELVDSAIQPPEVAIDFYAHKLTSPSAAETSVSLTGAPSNVEQQSGLERRISARTDELHASCALSMDVSHDGQEPAKPQRAKTLQSEDIFIGTTSSDRAPHPNVRSETPQPTNRRAPLSISHLEDELSMDDTLFALAVLLQRMVIPEVEVRSVFRKQTVSFALIPRKRWWGTTTSNHQ